MTRMIRCIEGHVFDVDAKSKCPTCGWEPTAKKESSTQNVAARVSIFGAMIAFVDALLAKAGIRNKPGLAGGIVYASLILFFIGGAYALTGALRSGSTSAPNAVNVPPADKPVEKEVQKAPAQQQQQTKQQQQNPNDQGGQGGAQQVQQPASPQQQQQQPYRQQPHIHVPGEIRQLLRRIF